MLAKCHDTTNLFLLAKQAAVVMKRERENESRKKRLPKTVLQALIQKMAQNPYSLILALPFQIHNSSYTT